MPANPIRNPRGSYASLCLVLVLGSTAGCSGEKDEPAAQGSVTVIGLAPDRSVDISDAGPAKAPGPGTDPVSRVYDVGPDGDLDTTATVRIKLERTLPVGTPVAVGTRESSDEPWSYLPAVLDDDREHATFTTRHFSLFYVLSLDLANLVEQFKEVFQDVLVDGLTSDLYAQAAPPSCEGEDAARRDGFKITHKGPDTLYWCFGVEKGERVLKATNRRSFPLTVEHPNMAVLSNQAPEPLALSNLSRFTSGKNFILAPRGTATLNADLEYGQSEGISTDVDATGQTYYAIETGARSLAAILTRFGAAPATRSFDSLFTNLECGAALGKSIGDALATCLSPKQIIEIFGPTGWLLAPLVVAAPLVAFFKSQAEALISQIDGTDDYEVVITRANDEFLIAPGRIGPYRVGATAQNLRAAGLVKPNPQAPVCDQRWAVTSQSVWADFRDGNPDDLDTVALANGDDRRNRSQRYATATGISRESTVGDLKRAYGDDLRYFEQEGEGGLFGNYAIFGPEGVIVFVLDVNEFPTDGTEPMAHTNATRLLTIAVDNAATVKDIDSRIYGGC